MPRGAVRQKRAALHEGHGVERLRHEAWNQPLRVEHLRYEARNHRLRAEDRPRRVERQPTGLVREGLGVGSHALRVERLLRGLVKKRLEAGDELRSAAQQRLAAVSGLPSVVHIIFYSRHNVKISYRHLRPLSRKLQHIERWEGREAL